MGELPPEAAVLYVPAGPEHIAEISEIERLSFAAPWSPESFRQELAGELAHYFAALRAGRVIGYCGYWNIVGEAHITNVAVHPDFRGRRVGARLLETMLADIQNRNIRGITLEVREDNLTAIRLYKGFGFQKKGRRKNYYQKEKKSAIIMWKYI
jgi:ribosomal-protein-alanine N-acetyltransferase